MLKKTSYLFSADVIRVLAIFAVVAIHTTNAVYGRPDFFGGLSWWFAIIINSISRPAIPLFIMLSGFLLLDKDESFIKSLQRLVNRILIPLVFWFIIYLVWNGGYPSLSALDLSAIFRFFSVNVFELYFLVIMLGLYFAAPILRAFLLSVPATTQKYFMFVLLAFGVMQTGYQYIYHQCSPSNIFIHWLPYTGLFVAGLVLGKTAKQTKRIGLLTVLYVIALLTTIGMGFLFFYFKYHGNNPLDFNGCLSYYSDYYLSINVIVMSICAFIFLLRFNYDNLQNLFVRKLVHSLARCSLGIYILHIIVLDVFDSKLHLFDPISPAWLYVIVKLFCVFLVSYGITLLFMRTPGIKRLLGETN